MLASPGLSVPWFGRLYSSYGTDLGVFKNHGPEPGPQIEILPQKGHPIYRNSNFIYHLRAFGGSGRVAFFGFHFSDAGPPILLYIE